MYIIQNQAVHFVVNSIRLRLRRRIQVNDNTAWQIGDFTLQNDFIEMRLGEAVTGPVSKVAHLRTLIWEI